MHSFKVRNRLRYSCRLLRRAQIGLVITILLSHLRETVVVIRAFGFRYLFLDEPLDTRLHRQIGRLVHRVLTRWMARQVGCHRNRREERDQARPGIIMAVQSFGSGLRPHVHFHILVTDGVYFLAEGGGWRRAGPGGVKSDAQVLEQSVQFVLLNHGPWSLVSKLPPVSSPFDKRKPRWHGIWALAARLSTNICGNPERARKNESSCCCCFCLPSGALATLAV